MGEKCDNYNTINLVNNILKKYNIGKKPLSKVLGFGEVTIARYLEGQKPSKENANLLQAILDNPYLFELFLLNGKNKITNIAFKKSFETTKQLQKHNKNKKNYLIAFYILKNIGETTILNLQRIFYFVQTYSSYFLKKDLITDKPYILENNLIYKDIYNCFCHLQNELIAYDKLLFNYDFNLTPEEEKYINLILNCFACYSPNILQKMLCFIQGSLFTEYKNRFIELKLLRQNIYEATTEEELKNYSKELFTQIRKGN